MTPQVPLLLRTARWLTFGSAVAALVSIAVCQILLALALAALLLSGERLRLPPIKLPLALFLGGTLLSLAFSAEPAAGLPQVRKIYVFLMLLLVCSTLRDLAAIRRLYLWWAGVGAVIALRGFVQFWAKMEEARALGQNFYQYYVAERITGFMSHWMTFSGQQMFVLLMLAAFLMFAPRMRHVWIWLGCLGIVGAVLVLGFTRSIVFVAVPGAGLYLIWNWKKKVLLAAPLLAVLAFLAAPASVQERFTSMLQPRKEIDSNEHRIITWRTGLVMIREHPLLGLGPEMVNRKFNDYVPADIRRPLPAGWYGHLHNIYLHYAAERGIPVAAALMWVIGKMVADFARALRRLPPGRSDERFVLHGAIAVIIATLLGGIFELNLGDSEVLTMFLVVAGSGYAAVDAAPAKAAPAAA